MQSAPIADKLPVQDRLLPLFLGYFVSKALLVSAQLDIAERLAGGARTTKELAHAAGADERSLYRLLRTLASVGVFQEDESGRFSNTDLSEALRSDVPGNLKSWAFTFCDGPAYSAWDEAGYSVRTSRCAFEKVHGSHPFEHMAKNPEFGRLFGEAMTSLTWNENAGIHANIDFSSASTLVDVGGGNGQFLMSCLAKNPNQRGILLDRPDVLGRARELVDASGYANRCEIVGGDFFKEVPAGDAYVMKYILHDWGDEEALTILKNIHRASRKGTKLYVMDMVVEPGNAPSFAKMVDLWALVFYGGGRERTRAEFESLFRAAGFRLVRAVPTSSFINTIEAERE